MVLLSFPELKEAALKAARRAKEEREKKLQQAQLERDEKQMKEYSKRIEKMKVFSDFFVFRSCSIFSLPVLIRFSKPPKNFSRQTPSASRRRRWNPEVGDRHSMTAAQ